jgi:hypothetical protein
VKRGLTRRTFNKLGVLTGAGAWVLPTWTVAAWGPQRAVDLTPGEVALIERFTEVMLPTEETTLKPRSEVPVVDNIAHALSLIDEPTLEQVRVGFKLFDYGAYLSGFYFTRFVSLTNDQCIAYIHRWENGFSMQRGIVDLLKKLTYIGYWQDIEAARAIGYQGPVSIAGGIPYLGNAPMPADGQPT